MKKEHIISNKIIGIKKIIIVFTLVFICCLGCSDSKNNPKQPKIIDSMSVFKNLKLLTDSVEIEIKHGGQIELKTNQKPLKIELIEVSKFCDELSCPTCDVSSIIRLRITTDTTKNTFPRFDLGWGASCKASTYHVPSCNFVSNYVPGNYVTGNNYLFENLIFSVIELFPYAKTPEENRQFHREKTHKIKLVIKNVCK